MEVGFRSHTTPSVTLSSYYSEVLSYTGVRF